MSCTDRKTLPAPKALQLREIPKSKSLDEACKIWAASVSTVSNASHEGQTRELRDLYGGEYWKVALKAAEVANLLVASAGLGLLGPDSKGPGYGATFVAGSPDSVLRFDQRKQKGDIRSAWWDELASNGLGTESWTKKTSDIVLVVLSSSYQQALSRDLKKLADEGKQVIVMSGSHKIAQLGDIKNIEHVETGQWLRMVLGGSTSCVGIRFAEHLLRKNSWHSKEEIGLELERMLYLYNGGRVVKLPVFNRITQTDEQVINWIKCESSKRMDTSKSVLHREYREIGFACEQKRFGILYEKVRHL